MWKTSKPTVEKLLEKKDTQGLLAALNDNDSTVVAAAAKALGELAEPGAVEALQEKALTGNLAAIAALGMIGGPEAVQALVHLTQREDFPHHVLAGIIQALGKTEDPQIVDHIKDFLTSEDDWILGETLEVLRKFLSEKEVAFLMREQQDLKKWEPGEKERVLVCENCRKHFTHQQARVDSIDSLNGSFTRHLFICPECGGNLLDSECRPYEEYEEHPVEKESEDEE